VVPEISKEDLRAKTKEQPYSAPSYYFEIVIENCKAHSGLLEYKDWIEIEFKDDKGNAIANKKYKLYLSNGEVRQGTVDGSGRAKEENISPGRVEIFIDPRK
jgi:translation initiation factor IF-1